MAQEAGVIPAGCVGNAIIMETDVQSVWLQRSVDCYHIFRLHCINLQALKED